MIWTGNSIEGEAQDGGNPHERRRGLRIKQQRPAKVFEPGAGRYIPACTHDVSNTGLRLEMPVSAPVLPGLVLSIHVGVGADGETLANRRTMLPARVVWVDRSSSHDDGKLVAGVEFVMANVAYVEAA